MTDKQYLLEELKELLGELHMAYHFDDFFGEAEEFTLTESFGSFKITDEPVNNQSNNLESVFQDFISQNINGFKIKVNNDHPECELVFVWFNKSTVNIHGKTFTGLRAGSHYRYGSEITLSVVKEEIEKYTRVNTIIEDGKIVRLKTPIQREYTIITF